MPESTPQPRRRWFQFSLASLFFLTTLVAIWLAWELAFIRERQVWIKQNTSLLEPGQSTPPVVAHIPWWRMLLGDEAVPTIENSDDWPEEERVYATKLFPEAILWKTDRPIPRRRALGRLGPARNRQPRQVP